MENIYTIRFGRLENYGNLTNFENFRNYRLLNKTYFEIHSFDLTDVRPGSDAS